MTKKHVRPRPIRDWLRQPVIPVVHEEEADAALLADASLIFLQGIQLAELSTCVSRLREGPTGCRAMLRGSPACRGPAR